VTENGYNRPVHSCNLSSADYGKRLAIVVPYRNRHQHLKQFFAHITKYFQRDKLDNKIEYSIHVVEQLGNAPFNAGKIRNCGFALSKDQADYFCFNDVDYLPLWADYSYVSRPTRLIWHGLTLQEDHENFFGAVVMFNKNDFLTVNGYSNGYWGWGFEDCDIALRCNCTHLDIEKRDGTFLALKHKNDGLNPDGSLAEEAARNRKLFNKTKRALDQTYMHDGLSTLSYELNHTARVIVDGTPFENIHWHKVTI